MKNRLIIFIILLNSLVYGQDVIRCVSAPVSLTQKQINTNSEFEERISTYLNSNKRVDNSPLKIPVVVHVIYHTEDEKISTQQIESQIAALNRDYNRLNQDTALAPSVFRKMAGSAGIEFYLAVQDPEGKPTSGITYTMTSVPSFSTDHRVKYSNRGGIDAWDPFQYLNIWVCNLGGSTLGYFPDQYPEVIGSALDGVVITYNAFGTIGDLKTNYNLGRTTTHEVGHYLGLYHLWGPPNSAPCSSDKINDTPPQQNDTKGCGTYPYIDECNNGPHGRNFSNFMDYTNDACMNMFTLGQSERMRAVVTNERSGLLTSKGLQSPFDYDLDVTLLFDTNTFCRSRLSPQVRITNRGKLPIHNFDVEVFSANERYSYPFDITLAPLQDTIWRLSELKLTDSVNITANISISPEVDEYLTNNSDNVSYTCLSPLKIFPNPATDRVFIAGNDPVIISCSVYNLSGVEILRTGSVSEISVSGLGAGYYLIILETENNALRYPLIVTQ